MRTMLNVLAPFRLAVPWLTSSEFATIDPVELSFSVQRMFCTKTDWGVTALVTSTS